MTEKIINALKTVNIETYIINDTVTQSAELFYVKKQLVMRRLKEKHIWQLSVCNDFTKDGEKMRGTTSIIIHPSMSEEEIEAAAKQAYYAASFVCNPYYELPEPEHSEEIKENTELEKLELFDAAEKMSAALFKNDNSEDAFINSAEIFVENSACRVISSNGGDVSYSVRRINGEFVVQCLEPQDVEMYHHFQYGELAAEALAGMAAEALETVRARAKATFSPKAGEYDIVLSGERLATLMSFYISRASANSIFAHYSNYEIGTKVQGEDAVGEKLNIVVKPELPFSPDGIRMREHTLIENGELKMLHGSTRFCRYLGVEPVGYYSRIALNNGSVPFEQLKQGRCLYIVSFSDFQCDDFSGHFGGEIRLAYLIENGQVTPVTGGSINGRLIEAAKDLEFSAERYSQSDYEGPFAVKLKGINVAGC